MNAIWTLAVKDLRILLRDKAGFFFTFFYPILIAVFFGLIFSGSGGSGSTKSALSVYVIDQDSTDISQKFVETLAQSEDLKLTPISLEKAQEEVRLGKKAAYILIKKGYGDARENMFTSSGKREIILWFPFFSLKILKPPRSLFTYLWKGFCFLNTWLITNPDLINYMEVQARLL